jgi:DNA primase
VALLREYCTALRCVTVLLDSDEAGRHAAEPIAGKLAQHWWVEIVSIDDGEEPDTVDADTLETLLTDNREL